jgi:predicted AlkP superfamily phosphohydrolase/phosphomutase
MKESKKRVLIVGLDGATFDVITPLVKAGRMPNLASLIAAGAHGILHSTIPPITPTAWTSFATGVNPGKHGVFDFQRPAPGTYDFRPVPAHQHEYKSLWRLASEAGKRVVALDVPFTYPPEPVNGCLICGYGMPVGESTAFTWPPNLGEELKESCGAFRPAVLEQLPNLRSEFFREWDEVLANRVDVADHLWSRVNWDIYMIVLGSIDNVQHVLWNYLEPHHADYYAPRANRYRDLLSEHYERADGFLGSLLKRTEDDTTVLVMSDHGFGSTHPGLHLPQLLMDLGLLKYGTGPIAAKGSSAAMRALLKGYSSLPGLRRLLNSLRPGFKTKLKHALSNSALLPSLENIDWANTLAFPTGFGLHIYVNRSDRFPQGIVSPGEECERLLERLSRKLLSITEPVSGAPIIRAIHRGAEVYHGPWARSAPDLIVEYTNFFEGTQGGKHPMMIPEISGSHVPEGILVAAGKAIREGSVDGASIEDLAPTVLHLLGLPVPASMDGRVLSEMLVGNWVESHPVLYDGYVTKDNPQEQEYDYSSVEAEQVREQLRGLGYV